MKDTPTDIPFLSNLGLMLTYKCSVACPHCIVEAGPHRKEGMSLKTALNLISEASRYGNGRIKGIALTGGEPFFDLEYLRIILDFGSEKGFVTSAVTNSFWATTVDRAIEVLSGLPALQMISLSTDIYHLNCIPFDNIVNAISAAKELGILYNIAVCTDNEEDSQYKKIIRDLLEITELQNIRTAITFPVGRAASHMNSFNYPVSSEPTVSACTMASSPVIFPEGSVMACIGPLMKVQPPHPLFLGNVKKEPLAKILDRAEENPILHAIRVWGPYKIISLLQERGFQKFLPDTYIQNCTCDVCYKLFSDRNILELIKMFSGDGEFKEKIAFARAYYLSEDMRHICRNGIKRSAPDKEQSNQFQ